MMGSNKSKSGEKYHNSHIGFPKSEKQFEGMSPVLNYYFEVKLRSSLHHIP